MKEIPLTQGKVAFVDDEDYERLSASKWFAVKSGRTFYAITKKNGRAVRMHWAVFQDSLMGKIDHENRNGLDNRKSNLRVATPSLNGMNRIYRESQTGFRGVAPRGNKFVSILGAPKDKGSYLGIYRSPIVAAQVRDCVARIRYGHFAILNFPYQWPT